MIIESLILGFIWYQIIAHIGISAGIHRYWAHRAFKAGFIFEVITLYMSVLAGSRSPVGWIAAHRMHHHHSDTEFDPHSPNTKGFFKILFNMWSITNIPSRYVKGLYKNKTLLFFHNHWGKIWICSALITFIISPYIFISFIMIPAILSFIGFGLVNAITHKNSQLRNVPWINILVAGEGYHKNHHEGYFIRYHKYDFTGYILEKFLLWNIFKRT